MPGDRRSRLSGRTSSWSTSSSRRSRPATPTARAATRESSSWGRGRATRAKWSCSNWCNGRMRRDVRASDDDRERCASLLTRHYVAGRLTLDELEVRLDRARVGHTRGELAAATADLPRPSRRRAAGAWLDRADRLMLRAHAMTFVAINLLLIAIWALFGARDFWPAWALVPTAILLAWHAGSSWTVRRIVRDAGSRYRAPSA